MGQGQCQAAKLWQGRQAVGQRADLETVGCPQGERGDKGVGHDQHDEAAARSIGAAPQLPPALRGNLRDKTDQNNEGEEGYKQPGCEFGVLQQAEGGTGKEGAGPGRLLPEPPQPIPCQKGEKGQPQISRRQAGVGQNIGIEGDQSEGQQRRPALTRELPGPAPGQRRQQQPQPDGRQTGQEHDVFHIVANFPEEQFGGPVKAVLGPGGISCRQVYRAVSHQQRGVEGI